MSEFIPEDEALLERARAGLDATPEDHGRVKRKLFAQIGIATGVGGSAISSGASAGAAGVGGSASVATASGLLGKIILTAIAVGAIGVGVAVARRSETPRSAVVPPSGSVALPSSSSQPPTAEVTPPASSAPLAAPSLTASTVAAVSPQIAPTEHSPRASQAAASLSASSAGPSLADRMSPPSSISTSAPRDVASSTASMLGTPPSGATTTIPSGPATVDAEAELLRRADGELKAGRAPNALALLDQHAAEFPNGMLIEEREAERVVVLCALGRTQQARDAATAFLRARPKSPLAARVRASCGGT